MNKPDKSQISRRGVFSLLGLGVVLGLAAPTAMLVTSDAEAQTAGMERRQDRRLVATNGVRIGALDATDGVTNGAEVPRRPTAQRRPTAEVDRRHQAVKTRMLRFSENVVQLALKGWLTLV